MSIRDEKTPMPAQPKTKEIPAVVPQVPATLDAVLREMRGMREEARDRFQEQADLLMAFGQRLVSVEQRQENSSIRAREPSAHDLEAKAELSKERAAREALAAEVTKIKDETAAQTTMIAQNTILTEKAVKALSGVAKHPAVIAFAFALLGFLTAWFKGHTP